MKSPGLLIIITTIFLQDSDVYLAELKSQVGPGTLHLTNFQNPESVRSAMGTALENGTAQCIRMQTATSFTR